MSDLLLVRELGGLELVARAGRRHADGDDGAAAADRTHRQRERLRPADGVEGDVELALRRPRAHGLGGAEPERLGPARFQRVDGDDARRAGDPGGLDDRTGRFRPRRRPATLDPGSTRARFSTAPTPVSAAQPIRAPCSSGTSSGSGSTAAAGTTIRSASAPIAVIR